MKMSIQREILLEPLQLIAGVVEKRQTLPILSTVLMMVQPEYLSLVGTNLEVELIGRVSLDSNNVVETGQIAVPAHKLMDICRLLPEKAILELSYDGTQLVIKSGRSRFGLSILPAQDFPEIEEYTGFTEFLIPQNQLKKLVEKTSFSMADQDVRYFLNGLQIQVHHDGISSAAADGHRLAFGSLLTPIGVEPIHAIVPRKGVIELLRLLDDSEDKVSLALSARHLRVVTQGYTFTSKLIDSGFVNYHELTPKSCDKSFIIRREELKQGVNRISVLSNEKVHGICFQLSPNTLKILASNMVQEYGEEEFNIDYQNDSMEITFSASYLLDILSAIRSEFVELKFASGEQGFFVKEPNQEAFSYIVMPII